MSHRWKKYSNTKVTSWLQSCRSLLQSTQSNLIKKCTFDCILLYTQLHDINHIVLVWGQTTSMVLVWSLIVLYSRHTHLVRIECPHSLEWKLTARVYFRNSFWSCRVRLYKAVRGQWGSIRDFFPPHCIGSSLLNFFCSQFVIQNWLTIYTRIFIFL